MRRIIAAAILAVCSILFISTSPADAKRLRSAKVHPVSDCFTDRGYGANCGAAWWQVEEATASHRPAKVKQAKRARGVSMAHEGAGLGSPLVARARAYMGQTAADLGLPRSLWCADFMNKITGAGTSRRARDYAHYGSPAPAGCVGCVAVLSRGKRGGGHVGVVSGYDARGNPIIVSGNHGRRVGEGAYARGRVIAWRWV